MDIITETIPLAIIARVRDIVRSVTFESPIVRRDLRPPYSLSDEVSRGNFKRILLSPGEHVISASVNDEPFAYSILVRVQPEFPNPLPGQVVPKPHPKGDLRIRTWIRHANGMVLLVS